MRLDPRTPVVVGVGQLLGNRARTVEGAREPLVLLAEALRLAERDAGVAGLLAAADSVHAVHVASWAYAGLAGQVARAVGATPRHLEDTGLGGHLPVRLLDRAAARIAAGHSRVALLVGGEAQASVSLLGKAGVDPVAALGWTADPGGPPAFDLDQLGSPAMQAAGLVAPTRVYPLYENRLQADLGLTPAQAHAWSAELYAALSRVAATHPTAWNRSALTAAKVGEPSPANRLVCEPYPLSMNAMPHVDQAAAVVLTDLETARAHGVEHLVHVRGGAGCDDDPDVLTRPGLGASRSLAGALDRCLALGGDGVPDLVDVYSCFPVVPKLVGLHLGLPREAVLSVTGGHSSFGGPLNSYALHAIATTVERLRTRPGTALVHANGGYLTFQHAVLLATAPHPDGYAGVPEPHRLTGDVTVRPLADGDVVDAVVETATVEHDRAGAPAQAFLVARLSTGERVATSTPPGDAAAARVLSLGHLAAGATTHVGRPVRIAVQDGLAAVT